ncbi:hypothetical protein EJB05_15847 [Eragrostis curvula]|uniref:Peptidase A1 domain-containing protein n=1 Tax=Eragrostis curvula TaxID=38414 RepID=A0A5J9VDH2_9POAL|nr:hypothetical protein EJB05_15847 [Eragrostis curvula]
MRMLAMTLILLSTSIEGFAVFGPHKDCSSIWNENKQYQQRKTGRGALRLSLLNLEHPCSPVWHQGSLSWHRSRSLERERRLAARLLHRRRLQEPATEISAPVTLAGAYYGFVAQVSLGTPPTRQTVLIDTAASFSWVQCEPCGGTGTAAGCFDQDGPRFNPDDSTTYRETPCLSPSCLLTVGNTSAPGHCTKRKDRCIYYISTWTGRLPSG